jgi:hypothetical protein
MSKTLFIIPTDAHYYKSVEMLKQFKVITLAQTCFGSCRNHHQGAVVCLAKTTDMVFSVLVDMDSVNVISACCAGVRSRWREEGTCRGKCSNFENVLTFLQIYNSVHQLE